MNPEEKFVVDCCASMHMLSMKDLNPAELETVSVSKSSTTVVTANGELQTKEEATVYVKELDVFVTVMLLEDTPAVLSLRKLCEDHGYSYHWTSGQKPQLIKDCRRIKCNTANSVPIVVHGLSTGSSSSATPTSPTSVLQEAEHPASTKSESSSSTVWVSRTRSSRESSSGPRGEVVSDKHSIYTHLPKDKNCEICMKTKITTAPCRKRTGTVVPRVENLVI